MLDPLVVPLVARPFSIIRPDPRVVLTIVAATLGLPIERLTSRNREPDVTLARRVAVQTGIRAGLTAAEMAAALGVTRQAASKLVAHQLDAYAAAAVSVSLERLKLETDRVRRAAS